MESFDILIISGILVPIALALIGLIGKGIKHIALIITLYILIIVIVCFMAFAFHWPSAILGIRDNEKEIVDPDSTSVPTPTPTPEILSTPTPTLTREILSTPTPTPTERILQTPIPTTVLTPIPPVTDSVENNVDVRDNPYPDFDSSVWDPFNSNEFTLVVDELVVKILSDGYEQSLGVAPTTSILMQVDLIDFDSGDIIDSKIGYLGDTVHFGDIPNGIYYYRIKCDGYKTTYSIHPFILEYNNQEPTDILPWIVSLEKIDAEFGKGFKVKMISSGEPIPQYTETMLSVAYRNAKSEYPVYINEDGFLTLWMGTDSDNYYFIATFYVANGYTLSILNKDNKPIEAHPEPNGICVLQY
ncbi:MAG: hypothetical protein IKI17_04740 [Oscillospiraceae bacterium]|nr:hypothetical protein [Oscillospiraceae bacterium]